MSRPAPIRYSGYRINQMPIAQQQIVYDQRVSQMQHLIPFIQEAMFEPFFIDDCRRDQPALKQIMHIFPAAEIFECSITQDEQKYIVGIAVLRGIIPGRECTLEAWTHPAFRKHHICGGFIRDIIDYAFRPWNAEQTEEDKKRKRGLGVLKIKAQTSIANRSAIRALTRLGFIQVGRSPFEGLFGGLYTDVIYAEKHNPSLISPPEAIEHHDRSQSADSTNIRGTSGLSTASSLPESGELHPTEFDSSNGGHATADNRTSERDRGERGLVGDSGEPAVKREQSEPARGLSDGPGGHVPIRTTILDAIRKSANRKHDSGSGG